MSEPPSLSVGSDVGNGRLTLVDGVPPCLLTWMTFAEEMPGVRILADMRCDELRLTGSGGANRVMEAELKRLVMRSAFEVRVPKPRREGESTLLYPFDA